MQSGLSHCNTIHLEKKMSKSQTPIIVRPGKQQDITGLPISTAWGYAKDPNNEFPSPRKFGPNVTGWLYAELVEWAETRQPIYDKKPTDT